MPSEFGQYGKGVLGFGGGLAGYAPQASLNQPGPPPPRDSFASVFSRHAEVVELLENQTSRLIQQLSPITRVDHPAPPPQGTGKAAVLGAPLTDALSATTERLGNLCQTLEMLMARLDI